MEDLRQIIAVNIASLRKERHMMQAELADQLGYTDKAVSKWERGESIPDIVTLKKLSDLFGVSLDYLCEAEHPEGIPAPSRQTKSNRLVITLLASSAVWLLATTLFVYMQVFGAPGAWKVFVGAVPVTMIVLLVFNSIWGWRRLKFVIVSVLLWTSLAFVYLLLLRYDIYLAFTIGIPIQIMVVLWSKLK